MRIFISCLVWIIFVGGLGLYMHHRSATLPSDFSATPIKTRAIEGFTLEVVTTFSLEPDPFAFQEEDGTTESPMTISLDARVLARISDGVLPGVPLPEIRIGNMTAGTHELFIRSAVPDDGRMHAVRLRILRSGITVTETTIWSHPGSLLSDIYRFEVPPSSDKGAPHA